MHLGDDRGIQAVQQGDGRVERLQQILGPLHRVGLQGGQIAPGDKGPPGPFEQHGPHAAVGSNLLHGRQQRLGSGHIQGVELRGAVELQGGDAVGAGKEQRMGHK